MGGDHPPPVPFFSELSTQADLKIMPWIQQIPIEKATGLLKKQFEAALKRAGRVWHIVHIMSLNPPALRDSIAFYSTIMHKASPLSRVQRELLATVVSAELNCFY